MSTIQILRISSVLITEFFKIETSLESSEIKAKECFSENTLSSSQRRALSGTCGLIEDSSRVPGTLSYLKTICIYDLIEVN